VRLGIGLTSDHEATVRGVYLVMAPAAWFTLVPLAHASLLSGVVLSLGTAVGSHSRREDVVNCPMCPAWMGGGMALGLVIGVLLVVLLVVLIV
jgi:hypothetical protein